MKMRACIPRVPLRVAGIGNVMIPWARAFVAASVLDIPLLPPAFGLNRWRYWRHFGTPRYDVVTQRALLATLPVVEFDERAFRDHGGDSDSLSSVIRRHAEAHRLKHRCCFVWTTEGMWGGYRHIAEAKDFARATLYRSRFAARNLLALKTRLDPKKITVGLHVRLGDFDAAEGDLSRYRNRFNVSLPIEWYQRVAMRISQRLGSDVQFLLVSDGRPEQIDAIARPIGAVTTYDLADSDCSDLLALADCDLLVCSVSSYSAWAAFLSDAPYLWFEPNLNHHPEGVYSIWGHEDAQRASNGATARAIERYRSESLAWPTRGNPVGIEGTGFDELIDPLRPRMRYDEDADLVTYGIVPAKAVA